MRWKPPRRFRSQVAPEHSLYMCHHPQCQKTSAAPQIKSEMGGKNPNKSAAGWKGGAGEHLQSLRCYWCCREQPDLHCNHSKPPCAIHSPSCNFETLSLPRNFSAGHFSFAPTQNEAQLLAGSTHTTPHMDRLRTTKPMAHHSQHFSLQVLHRSLPFLPKLESYPHPGAGNSAEAPWCRWKQISFTFKSCGSGHSSLQSITLIVRSKWTILLLLAERKK